MKDQLKGFLKINHNGVEVSVNPLQIETYQPYQAHDNPDTDKILIVMASGQTFIVSNKDFDLEGWEKEQEAKLVAEREAEKARREQEKKDLEEINKTEAAKEEIRNITSQPQNNNEVPWAPTPKRGPKPKGK